MNLFVRRLRRHITIEELANAVTHGLGLALSIVGFVIALGLLVDDSIVVIENITRFREMGRPPEEAAIEGRTEIGGAAIAITLVDVVVFAPIAFMSGVTGQWLHEFGLVIVIATLVYALWPKNREQFHEAARMPLRED